MPVSAQDQARSILLSDHNLDGEALKHTAKSIAAGETPTFDETAVAQMAVEFEELRKNPPARPLGCLIFQWSLLAIVVLLVVTLLYFYWCLHHRS